MKYRRWGGIAIAGVVIGFAASTSAQDADAHRTMHTSSVDLSKVLAGNSTPTGPVFVPTPNHSHVVDDSRVNAGAIWRQVRPVMIFDQSDWPAADESSGITSAAAMDDAETAGRAVEVGSNFFLFFSSKSDSPMHHSGTPAGARPPPPPASTPGAGRPRSIRAARVVGSRSWHAPCSAWRLDHSRSVRRLEVCS